MTATLYRPNQLPLIVNANNLPAPNEQGYARVTEQIADLLECSLKMVDILAVANNYVVYSVFDDDGEINTSATNALTEITGIAFNSTQEDETLRGNILIQIID
jgi:hypothetical protein